MKILAFAAACGITLVLVDVFDAWPWFFGGLIALTTYAVLTTASDARLHSRLMKDEEEEK